MVEGERERWLTWWGLHVNVQVEYERGRSLLAIWVLRCAADVESSVAYPEALHTLCPLLPTLHSSPSTLCPLLSALHPQPSALYPLLPTLHSSPSALALCSPPSALCSPPSALRPLLPSALWEEQLPFLLQQQQGSELHQGFFPCENNPGSWAEELGLKDTGLSSRMSCPCDADDRDG